MIKYSQAPKYAPSNDSIGGKHDELNPGPEFSKFDIARHEQMRLKYPKRVFGTTDNSVSLCSHCGTGIYTSDSVRINGETYHGSCFVNARNQESS